MSTPWELGTASAVEVRDLIARTLVQESAEAAGLEVASPDSTGEGRVFLVYGGEATETSALRARRVRVRCFDSGCANTALEDPIGCGDLVALVEWGGSEETDAVYLLGARDIDGVQSGRTGLSEFVAGVERWRALVLG